MYMRFLNNSKYSFKDRVNVYNDDYNINSDILDYFSDTEKAFFYGPTVINGVDYTIFCEKGFYDTKNKNGYFVKKSKILYDKRKIEGDSLIFDDKKQYASGTFFNSTHLFTVLADIFSSFATSLYDFLSNKSCKIFNKSIVFEGSGNF